jgi:thymidylate synthase
MAKQIVSQTFGNAWIALLDRLVTRGEESSPRNLKTKEILNASITVKNSLHNILVSSARDLNYRFMVAEWLWILAGLNDVNVLAQYNSQMKQFSDNGEILSGAYGPRLMPQIPYVLESLKKPDSRQAVATIWTPSPQDSKDIPCTISLQWLIRQGKLHCIANMRSSDIWLGLPYDFFTFSQITNYLASLIKIDVGSLSMNLGSSHLYENHWEPAILALRGQTKTARSPRIPSVPLPDLKRLLNQEDTAAQHGEFWDTYREALSHNKAHALDILGEFGETHK